MSDIQGPSPLRQLWSRQFPFTYWDNRLEKISRYNPEDRLETLYVMLQLVDLYVHIFTARVRNPEEPWFMIKERTYSDHIRTTLEKLEVEDELRDGDYDTTIVVERLFDEPEGLVGFKAREDWPVEPRDWWAADFLGCPAEPDPETQSIEFFENPDLHFGAVNSVLNFWRENVQLLNDFKHGFRVLPCTAEVLRFLTEQNRIDYDESFDQLLDELEESESNGSWELHFMRLSTNENHHHYEIDLNIHRADIEKCRTFAKMTLYLLHNLFGRGGEMYIGDFLQSLARGADEGVITVIDRIASMELVMYKPGRGPEDI